MVCDMPRNMRQHGENTIIMAGFDYFYESK